MDHSIQTHLAFVENFYIEIIMETNFHIIAAALTRCKRIFVAVVQSKIGVVRQVIQNFHPSVNLAQLLSGLSPLFLELEVFWNINTQIL